MNIWRTIWPWYGLELAKKTNKPLHVGGIYRQHKLPKQGKMSKEDLILFQRERWDRIVKNWSMAAKGSRCICIGDINLDFGRWDTPDPQLTSMVTLTKQMIENKGSVQIIKKITRSWNKQRDSILDHIWLNCCDRLLNYDNIARSVSDHNVILCNISQNNIKDEVHNTLKRSWKKFNTMEYKKELEQTDWTELYVMTDVNEGNNFLTEKIQNALDNAAPLIRVQNRRNYCSWISDITKNLMSDRDTARELARETKKMRTGKTIKP